MQFKILIGRNRFSTVSGEPTAIPELFVTKWRGEEGRGYTLTHSVTGRCITLRPILKSEINGLVRCLELCDIDWAIMIPGEKAKRELLTKLSEKEATLMGLTA